MGAEETAKSELRAKNELIREYAGKILDEVDEINNSILPGYLNATPDAREKNAILKVWNPMVLDCLNGLDVLNQGVAAADKIVKS